MTAVDTPPGDDAQALSDALLAADFGLISTSSLVVGVACASTERETVLAAAMVVLFSGTFSMAAEQYLSVSTEADRMRAAQGQDVASEAEPSGVHPLRQAVAAAASFAAGALLPLLVVLMARPARIAPLTASASLLLLAVLGALGARIDGANERRAVVRIVFWGALAMGAAALEGLIFDAVT
jgi:VIT1/CCC1 family predicted Fe2+/Mn2+ transporter